MPSAAPWEGSRTEAERQLAAAAERHREAVNSLQELGRPQAGQHVAVKSAGRAVHLVSFALRRAAGVGVPFERLVELSGWEPDLVRAGLERTPEVRVISQLTPDGVDPEAVAHAAAGFEVLTRLDELTRAVRAEVDPDVAVGTPSPPAPADLEDAHERLQTAWRTWRQLDE